MFTIGVLEGEGADLPFLSVALGASSATCLLLLGPKIIAVVGASLRLVALVDLVVVLVDLQQVVVLALFLALVDLQEVIVHQVVTGGQGQAAGEQEG